MRLIIMFDLPTLTKQDRRYASDFRKFLIKDGFDMLQLSIYVRSCKGEGSINKHKKRIKTAIPMNGNVRILSITDAQYLRMEVCGNTKKKPPDSPISQLTLL